MVLAAQWFLSILCLSIVIFNTYTLVSPLMTVYPFVTYFCQEIVGTLKEGLNIYLGIIHKNNNYETKESKR